MNPNVKAYIESGVLELYVMGASNPEEALAVEQMAAAHPEVRQELESISLALERYAQAHAVKPRNTVKPLLLATIDYMERLKHGEVSRPRLSLLTPASGTLPLGWTGRIWYCRRMLIAYMRRL